MKNSAAIASAFAGTRPGAVADGVQTTARVGALDPVTAGLDLSDIMYKPREWFRLNPANEIFRSYKSEQYLADLERDIRSVGILSPLKAMPDGLLLAGESRLLVAERIGIERLPVRLVLSPLSPEEQEQRLLLDNLLRFEIPQDVRLLAMARAWPGYFLAGDTVSPGAPTVAEIAEAAGVTPRTVMREKAIVREAQASVAAEGREVGVGDLEAARNGKNETRRKAGADSPQAVILRVRAAMDKIRIKESESLGEGRDAYRESADMIEEALG